MADGTRVEEATCPTRGAMRLHGCGHVHTHAHTLTVQPRRHRCDVQQQHPRGGGKLHELEAKAAQGTQGTHGRHRRGPTPGRRRSLHAACAGRERIRSQLAGQAHRTHTEACARRKAQGQAWHVQGAQRRRPHAAAVAPTCISDSRVLAAGVRTAGHSRSMPNTRSLPRLARSQPMALGTSFTSCICVRGRGRAPGPRRSGGLGRAAGRTGRSAVSGRPLPGIPSCKPSVLDPCRRAVHAPEPHCSLQFRRTITNTRQRSPPP
jgi:hypothetical protein